MSKMIRMCTMLALGFVLVSNAHAQARPGGGRPVQPVVHSQTVSGKVNIGLAVVHANNSGRVDPDLKAVAGNFKHTRFTGFQKLEQFDSKLGENEEASFSIVGDHKVKVKLVSRDSRAAKVRVMMFNDSKKVMDTTVAIYRNRAFMIAGTDYKGGKLILPLTVRY